MAATDEFAEKGLAGARVEEIAARTEASKHMIYYHFGNKDGLYSAVLERAYAEFRLAEGVADYSSLPPIEALRQLVGSTFDIHVGQPQIVRIIMGENLNCGVHVRNLDSFSQRQTALGTLHGILDRGRENGSMRPDLEPLQVHLTISALCFHYVANAHTYSHVFEISPFEHQQLARRRQEIVETVVAHCTRASSGHALAGEAALSA